ncbi:MAG: hypothetical protein E8D46_08925 [Nitrospira sp.]|nr:MAG: hypothetical protein E8D46_08925 [Nitrospira sp.]
MNYPLACQVKAMPDIHTPQTLIRARGSRLASMSLSLFLLFAILSIWPAPTLAEVRVLTALGEHRMGNRDTREEAIRLATEAAKRNALEQVAVYLESITIVDGLDVTKDEIRTYTAGIVLVLKQTTNTTLDGDTVVVRTDLVAQIDTDEVRQAIAALRENEDARHQLVELQQENDQLQQDLAAANLALAQASTSEQTQQAAQQRQDILNRVQSNAMVSQAWTDWALVSPAGYSSSSLMGLAQLQALLNAAQGLYPTSSHVHMAQQVMTTRQPSAPPQPPSPPVPGIKPPTMPRYLITPAPGFSTVRRTLNEFTYKTQTVPPQAAVEQAPVARRLPQKLDRIHPPPFQQRPPLPNQIQMAPKGTGGSRQSGEGR